MNSDWLDVLVNWLFASGVIAIILWILLAVFWLAWMLAPVMIWINLSKLNDTVDRILWRMPPLDQQEAEVDTEEPDEEDLAACPRCQTEFVVRDVSNIRCPACQAVLEA